jgi:dienelactone hydrolase
MKTFSPAAWPRWMQRLIQPASSDRVDRPLRVVSHTKAAVKHRVGSSVRTLRVRQYDLEVPYLSTGGQAKTGAARLFVRQDAKAPIPLIAIMHYELGLEGAGEYMAEGWAVMTPREGLNPFADSVNFNLALVQVCRQLPFIDGQRIALVGGSAGGYVTLMVASQTFPVAAAAALAPLSSMPYNVEFFARNTAVARCGAKDEKGNDASCVPVFCSIAEAITGFAAFLGPLRQNWRQWLRNSPVGVLNLVTCPVLATFSTADTLVPINQLGDAFAIQPAKGVFPERFEFARRAVVATTPARRTFMQGAGGRARVFRVVVPDTLTKFWDLGGAAPPSDYLVPCKFSRSQRFSILILDEGAPDPRLGHFKYCFGYTAVPFLRHCFGRRTPLAADQLTLGKLERLMRRFRGDEADPLVGCEEPGKPPMLLTRRNTTAREKADVIAGLRAYCESGEAHRRRLRALYRKLPASLRALDAGEARFDENIVGGLAYHEALLHHDSGDAARARALAQEVLRRPAHRAYSACLPAELLRPAHKRSIGSQVSAPIRFS